MSTLRALRCPACGAASPTVRPAAARGGGTRAAWTRAPTRLLTPPGDVTLGRCWAEQAFFSSACQEDRAHSTRRPPAGPPTPRSTPPAPSTAGRALEAPGPRPVPGVSLMSTVPGCPRLRPTTPQAACRLAPACTPTSASSPASRASRPRSPWIS